MDAVHVDSQQIWLSAQGLYQIWSVENHSEEMEFRSCLSDIELWAVVGCEEGRITLLWDGCHCLITYTAVDDLTPMHMWVPPLDAVKQNKIKHGIENEMCRGEQ